MNDPNSSDTCSHHDTSQDEMVLSHQSANIIEGSMGSELQRHLAPTGKLINSPRHLNSLISIEQKMSKNND